MPNFTQLNLNDSSKPAPKPALALKQNHGGAKVLAIAGSLVLGSMVLIMTLGTNGCSKKSANNNIVAPAEKPWTPQPSVSMTPAPVETPKPVKKASRQHKLATFKSAEYGLSFRYPKHYNLKEGEETDSSEVSLASQAMNFVQPGGTSLSTIEMPGKLYSGTDFESAFFTVNVNPSVTADECSQFAFPEKSGTDDGSPAPATVNIAGTNYSEMDDLVSDGDRQADARYYHLFQNNVCYEFALSMQTAANTEGDALKPVNRDKVFDKLQWMLATVKIKPVEIKAIEAKTAETKPIETKAEDAKPVEATPVVAPTTSAATTPSPGPTNQ